MVESLALPEKGCTHVGGGLLTTFGHSAYGPIPPTEGQEVGIPGGNFSRRLGGEKGFACVIPQGWRGTARFFLMKKTAVAEHSMLREEPKNTMGRARCQVGGEARHTIRFHGKRSHQHPVSKASLGATGKKKGAHRTERWEKGGVRMGRISCTGEKKGLLFIERDFWGREGRPRDTSDGKGTATPKEE